MLDRLKSVAADCGLPFGVRTVTYNSRRAWEVGKWAESRNKGEAFHMAVFKAYFADGLNIGKIPVLVDLAESVGLKGAEEVLSKGIFKEAVDNDWKILPPPWRQGCPGVRGQRPHGSRRPAIRCSGGTGKRQTLAMSGRKEIKQVKSGTIISFQADKNQLNTSRSVRIP